MTSSRKPVIVRKLTRDWCAGFAAVNPAGESAALELLDNSGKLMQIDWDTVKWVCYLREPLSAGGSSLGSDAGEPERLLRRSFLSRPRTSGLWLRLTLADGDELEGLAANDRSLITGSGLLLTPPDTRSTTQRIFIPRSSIRELTVLAAIGQTSRAGSGAPSRRSSIPHDPAQPALFPAEPDESSDL